MAESPQLSSKPLLYIGADHGGFNYKTQLLEYFRSRDYLTEDCGASTEVNDDDYPDYAFAVAEKVQAHLALKEQCFGILLCRSGGGMVIAANKVPGIRAIAAYTEYDATHGRAHNNAQIISFAADELSIEEVIKIAEAFITTPFSGDERHLRRITKITQYEQKR